MFLINVKNGQHFCLLHNPCQIYKRICDYTRIITNLQGNQVGRTQIECWDLAAGEDVTFFKPKITKVLSLGKASKKKTI
jgi:hypothetical protein